MGVKQYVYICARMEVCETDPKTTWSNFAPCDLVTSEDFSLLHEDDVDGESGDEREMKAVDTLSELGSQSSSSKRLVTPQCKRDKLLQNRSLQVARLQNHALITSWHWQRHWKMQDMVPPMRSLLRPRVNSLTMCLGHKLSHATLKISFPSNLYICGFCGYSIQLL